MNRIYTMGDSDVAAPGIIRQDMPRLTPVMKTQAKERGVIEIVIDQYGRVSYAAIRTSVHPMFDAELLSAARDWRYQPATLAGKPVKYRKMIQINVSREP
jgi:TonB family protein